MQFLINSYSIYVYEFIQILIINKHCRETSFSIFTSFGIAIIKTNV